MWARRRWALCDVGDPQSPLAPPPSSSARFTTLGPSPTETHQPGQDDQTTRHTPEERMSLRRPTCALLSLRELPPELQIYIARELNERTDRAALCLALPPLGCAALRGLAEYRDDILMSVALRLLSIAVAAKHTLLNERLLRLYVADHRATHDGLLWLNAAFAAAGVDLQVQVAGEGLEHTRLFAGLEPGALLMNRMNGDVVHYEGEQGAERIVRLVYSSSSGDVTTHYEGEKGAERMVRLVYSSGEVFHYEGE